MKSCAAVFDIGTSSLKAALIDKNGCVYKQERLFFHSKVLAEDWVISFENLFKHLSDYAKLEKLKLCGICISGNGPTLVSVSKNSETLLLWNEKPPANFKTKIEQSRSIFLPRYELFKFLYPKEYDNADFIFSGQEFLIYKLTGKVVTVLPEARYTQAYYTDEDIKAFGIEKSKLPPFTALGTPCGEYRSIPVFAGAPDFIAALIGTNTICPGNACDRAGSSEGLNICVETLPSKEKLKGLLVLPSPVAPFWNVSFKIADSGSLFLNYIKENGGSFLDFDSFIKKIEELPAFPKGNYPKTVAGKGKRLVENLANQIKSGMDLLENATGFRPIYTLCGGQAKSEKWCKIKAEITGRKFKHLQIADAELLGNACIAFTALGEYKNLSEAARAVCKF